MSGSTYQEVQSARGKPSVPHAHSDSPHTHSDKRGALGKPGYHQLPVQDFSRSVGVAGKFAEAFSPLLGRGQGGTSLDMVLRLRAQDSLAEKVETMEVENMELSKADLAGILSVISPGMLGGFMDSIIPSTKWTPHELRTASILYERRTEDLQLQQLRLRLQKLRLQKKMREEADRASAATAA